MSDETPQPVGDGITDDTEAIRAWGVPRGRVPAIARFDLGVANPVIGPDGQTIKSGDLAEISLSAEDYAQIAPGLLHGLSIGTTTGEDRPVGQDPDRLIAHWSRTNMAIDAPVTPRSGDEG